MILLKCWLLVSSATRNRFLAFIIIGPIALAVGTGITGAVQFVFEHAGWLGGALYGFFYAPLVITGLHHMFLAVDFQLMGSKLGGTYLWPIVAISNICQGSLLLEHGLFINDVKW